ncbi:MAG: pantetheine-phosphate adenylyltransferase [bacterium]|nr:pantetheine-phosphate adenylyltransferase [bacterium]
MATAVCPGSFDPPTNGHMDVIRRSVSLFDQVVVAVIRNLSKTPMFRSSERVAMLGDLFADEPTVEIASFDGLLVDFAKDRNVNVIVKGLRAVSDFDYELQMAQMNHRLSGIDTVFVPTSPEHAYLSSSLVKEVGSLGGAVDSLVPPEVARLMKERWSHER